jgi:hypothetical protein
MRSRKDNTSRDAPIETADALWSAITQKAGLDLKRYDAPLLDELASVLHVASSNFGDTLDANGITIERLLFAFLKVIKPYARMTRDIMALFARASASRSNENLKMRFRFADSANDFEFDLENFREWESRWRNVLKSIDAGELSPLDADELRHAFLEQGVTYRIEAGRWIEIAPREGEITQWLRDAESESPSHLPRVPEIADPILADLIERVWGFLEVSIHSLNRETAVTDSTTFDAEAIRTIIRGSYLLSGNGSALCDRLAPILDRIPQRPVDVSVLREQLDELLSMPVWKRRHEVYSVWVGSRIVDVLGEKATIHSVDGTILFSFRASHLATLPLDASQSLQLWTELRTPLQNPIGKGRKAGIQPDYVLTNEPADDPSRSLIVVECKQYLQASKSNFGAAVIDYARGHPNAFILLVNYGPWNGILPERSELLDPSGRSRTRIIGQFHPDSPVALREFEAIFRELLPKPQTSQWAEEEYVRLVWMGPADLDLHCWLSTETVQGEHICYSNRSYNSGETGAELDQDVQAGPASEMIRFRGRGKRSIVVAVHNYSRTPRLAECSARIEMQIEGLTIVISAPSLGDGDWWSVLTYESAANRLEIVNAMASKPPR